MKQRAIVLSIFIFSLFFEACQCPDVRFPYHDFTSLIISYPNGMNVDLSEDLEFYLEDSNKVFLARNFGFKFINSSFAFSQCPTDGNNGRKFDVVNFNIKSDSDFNNTNLKNTSLNDLFYTTIYNSSTFEHDTILISDIKKEDLNNIYYLNLKENPSMSKKHVFYIELLKSNGDFINKETEIITWD